MSQAGVDKQWFNTLATAVAEDGVDSIGLADALDIGLERAHFTVVPKSAQVDVKFSKPLLQDEHDSFVYTDDATNAGAELKSGFERYQIVLGNDDETKGKKNVYYVDNQFWGKVEFAPMNDSMLRDIITANSPWIEPIASAENWKPIQRQLMYSVIIAQIMFGLIDADNDAEVEYLKGNPPVESDPKKADDEKNLVAGVLSGLKKSMVTAKLLMSAAILNHYKINHTVGQGSIQGFLAKIINTLPELRPERIEDPAAMRNQLGRLKSFMYLLLHRVAKRNGAFSLLEAQTRIAATVDPRVRPTIRFKKDDFIALRALGAPAGAGKIAVAIAAWKMMGSTGLIAFAPSTDKINTLANLRAQYADNPLGCHAGAKWYLKYDTQWVAEDWNQNSEDVRVMVAIASIFVKHIVPRSTLADSPAFHTVYDSARGEFAGFDAVCKSYADQRDKPIDSAKLVALLKVHTQTAQIADAEGALNVLLDDTKKASHAAAAKSYIDVCKAMVSRL